MQTGEKSRHFDDMKVKFSTAYAPPADTVSDVKTIVKV
jgi:hypothetical protein